MGLHYVLEEFPKIAKDADIMESLEITQAASLAAINILNDLLTFDKIEEGNLVLNREMVSAKDMLTSATSIFRAQSDTTSCREVASALVGGTAAEEDVTVTFVKVAVVDTGVGLTEVSTCDWDSPVSRSIIDLHGGAITVESAGADMGSCFTVYVPVTAPAGGTNTRLTIHQGALSPRGPRRSDHHVSSILVYSPPGELSAHVAQQLAAAPLPPLDHNLPDRPDRTNTAYDKDGQEADEHKSNRYDPSPDADAVILPPPTRKSSSNDGPGQSNRKLSRMVNDAMRWNRKGSVASKASSSLSHS
eukprot:gene1867-2196_t